MSKQRSRITLKRLISKKQAGLLAAVEAWMARADPPLGIRDAEGKLLMGNAAETLSDGHPVEMEGEILGRVIGEEETAVALAALLSQLAAREYEKRQLAGEVLDMYREINLLYSISEKMAAAPGLEPMTQVVVEEAGRLIEAAGGAVMSLDQETGALHPIAVFGEAGFADCEPVLRHIIETGKGEIINDIAADARFAACTETLYSLIAVPLKAGQKMVGILTLYNRSAADYTAADLKLLSALASQTAPVIEHALAYETKLREARAREKALQEQINRLRVQIDEQRVEEEVRSITETEYFQQLEGMIDELREEFHNE